MIVNCNVLCFNEKQQELTGKAEDIWLPLAIDFKYIFAIKKNGNGLDENDGNAVLWHKSGDYFVIDMKFEKAKKLWLCVYYGDIQQATEILESE